jgi:integrase
MPMRARLFGTLRTSLITSFRAGVPLLAMSKRLGHSSIAITGDLYSHVVEQLDRQAADLTADLLMPSSTTA